MAVELYKAQLAAHVNALESAVPEATAKTPADDSAAEAFAWRLFVIGAVIVTIVALQPFLLRLILRAWRRVRATP
jgi:hypothetical protein